ncbi:hypothetical protein GCM10011376_34610 [Nocardioides flavus (ex Wang et al. 2016)]|uniref:Transcriptional regulator, AbiEi antitoxin, Type IV TA system n=1 Tax=Nocardioides flavus (ex Wang et al. 2016) TaxID=2058780 RepID=A0ABQ3HMS2_9ACTN|nr:hypothetical protein [Nocardioides flavus (ex Wang et al. 2016)]GHE18851.1 hypothetical protein GCM10011376_34610 [Nocardioides flavus (ex Wang et al. 2016)]
MHVMPLWCRDVDAITPDAPIPCDRPFSAVEASRLGVDESLRRRLVQRGLLRPLLRGVFVVASVPDSLRLRVAALELVVPEHAVVVDRTAAWLHGVDALPRSAIHRMPGLDVFSTRGSRMRRPGVVSGTRDLTVRDVEAVGGLRVTTPLRTSCDLGRLLWRFDALSAIDGFLRLGLDHSLLLSEVGRFAGHRGVRQLRTLAPLGDPGAESPPESALRLHWYDADLPAPETQIWIDDDSGVPKFRIDVGDRAVRYGAEYFGEEFHDEEHREDDEARLGWLEEHRGWRMDVFTKVDVYGRELAANGRLRHGYETAAASRPTYIDLSR